MNWKTLAVLPIIAVMVYLIMAAVSFGERVGDAWSEATTTAVTNGLVMVCFGSSMFGIFIVSMIVAVALAARLLGAPRQPAEPRQPERWREGRIPRGWDEDVVDSTAGRGQVISVERPALGGLTPMLPGPSGGLVLPTMPTGAFDAMEETNDRRFRAE